MCAAARRSGLPLVGDLSWGTDFCQFYQTKEDLLEILVPFLRAGLQSGELCVFAPPPPLTCREALAALAHDVPDFEGYVKRGQVEVVAQSRWDAHGARTDRAILAKLDQAIRAGLEGLRLATGACRAHGKPGRCVCRGFEAVAGNNLVACCAYPRAGFDAVGLMEVVKNHRFALVKDAGRWEIIESAEARPVRVALRRTEEKLQYLFRNMSEGFAYHRIMLDERGRPCNYVFLEVNEAFENLTGLKGADIVGRAVTQVIPGIEKDPRDWIGTYGKTALTGEPVHFESYAEALGRWYLVSAFCPQKGYFAVTFSDITERKLAEQRITALNETLRRSVEELSAANEALEAFGHTVSHDLRAPLRHVTGYLQLIESRCAAGLDESGLRHLHAAERAAQHMERLIDELLAFSRTGRAELAPRQVDSDRLVREVLLELGAEARRDGLTLEVRALPRVLGDPTLLRLVWANLIGNAVKFTRRRDPAVIEIGARDEAAERVFYVRDNGAGFDMRHVGRLFGLFQRLHPIREFEGTGVGLANVARIVQRHGGRVWAEGTPNEGATFFFALPKERAQG